MSSSLIQNILWFVVGIIYLLTVKYEDTVVFLDVGQGDSTLIQKGHTQILVDGGPDESVLYQLQKYVPIYDRKIEYVILTHPHDDHLVGLLNVLDRYEVGEILYYPVCYENENYEYLLHNYDNLKKVGRGDAIRVSDLEINILWPILNSNKDVECIKQFDTDLNNDSLILDFKYLNKDFLLMGDIESNIEEVIVNEELIGSGYDVLKAGHHCSNSSSSETFLNMVSPGVAVCSASRDNSFGHPGSETLKKFSKFNVQYLVTYEEGNIQIK